MAKRFKHYDLTIGGETFEVCGETDMNTMFYGNDESQIYEVYGKPSVYKVGIWKSWCEWAKANNAQLDITSHNCMAFSIRGFIEQNGVRYLLWITKCYNRAYKVIA